MGTDCHWVYNYTHLWVIIDNRPRRKVLLERQRGPDNDTEASSSCPQSDYAQDAHSQYVLCINVKYTKISILFVGCFFF